MLAFASCKGKLNYKEKFEKNADVYAEMLYLLEENYILDEMSGKNTRLIFYDCNKENRRLNTDIRNKELADYMVQVNVTEIALEKEYCDYVKSK